MPFLRCSYDLVINIKSSIKLTSSLAKYYENCKYSCYHIFLAAIDVNGTLFLASQLLFKSFDGLYYKNLYLKAKKIRQMNMIPEEDQGKPMNLSMMEEQQAETSQVDYSSITKHPYISKVFCWIEQGNTAEVKRFFDTFPHLLNNFSSNNNWNPFLYAARYGNYELIDYFSEKKMKTTTSGRILSSYSIVHTAVYSGEAPVLDYILNKIDVTVNPYNCEASPLKVAMKANNPKMVEMLVAKGAYYVFGDVFNNVYQKPNIEEQNKYYSIQTNRDIPISMVVEEGIIKDCPIKETLKYARVKSIIAMRILTEKAGHNIKPQFAALASILSQQENMVMLLRMAVNRGQSILTNKVNANNSQPNDTIG